MFIAYEDRVLRPKATLLELQRFLRLPELDPPRMERVLNATSMEAMAYVTCMLLWLGIGIADGMASAAVWNHRYSFQPPRRAF